MNGDQLAPGQYAVSHQQPQLRGPPGQGRPHLPGQPADRRRHRHHRARSPMSAVLSSRDSEKADPRWNRSPHFTARLVALPMENIDTDQIIPARFLKTTNKAGLGDNLFADWRYDATARRGPTSCSTAPTARGAACWSPGTISAAARRASTRPGRCCGYGFRAVVSTYFADIFRNNALKNGLLPIVVDAATHAELMQLCARDPAAEVTVDLASQTLTLPGGRAVAFPHRPVRQALPAERRRSAGLPAGRGAGDRRLRGAHPARVADPIGAGRSADAADDYGLPGDGIGPEVIAEGVRVLAAVAAAGGHAVRRCGRRCSAAAPSTRPGTPLPEETLAALPGVRRRAARRGGRAEVGQPGRERAARTGPARPAQGAGPVRQPAPGARCIRGSWPPRRCARSGWRAWTCWWCAS